MLKNSLPTRLEAAVFACFRHERNLNMKLEINFSTFLAQLLKIVVTGNYEKEVKSFLGTKVFARGKEILRPRRSSRVPFSLHNGQSWAVYTVSLEYNSKSIKTHNPQLSSRVGESMIFESISI